MDGGVACFLSEQSEDGHLRTELNTDSHRTPYCHVIIFLVSNFLAHICVTPTRLVLEQDGSLEQVFLDMRVPWCVQGKRKMHETKAVAVHDT